jgi:hypothetical protein
MKYIKQYCDNCDYEHIDDACCYHTIGEIPSSTYLMDKYDEIYLNYIKKQREKIKKENNGRTTN